MATKRRKLHFSVAEKHILAQGIIKYGRFLHGPESHNTTPARRKEILKKITDRINAAGGGGRPGPSLESKKKINDLKSVSRNKLATLHAHTRGTGGGGPCPVRMSEEEWAVAQCFHPQQVVGLPGFDNDPLMRTGNFLEFLSGD